KILVGGVPNDGSTSPPVARLQANGTLDGSFLMQVPSYASSVQTLALQPDGRVIIGGSFYYLEGLPRIHIARLQVDGAVDRTFDPGGCGQGGEAAVYAVAVTQDGGVFVGGDFTSVNGVPRQSVVRLLSSNAQGTIEFTDPGEFGSIIAHEPGSGLVVV